MSSKITVNCKIPSGWKKKIKHLAAERSQPSEQIIYEAIAQYLGENTSKTNSRIDTLEEEVSELYSTIAQLSSSIKKLQQQAIAAASMNPLTGTPTTERQRTIVALEFDEDDGVEDEPDEILYDFLPPEER